MSYQFKVGDKGKTRDGKNYEVLFVTTKFAEFQVYAKVQGYSSLTPYQITGEWGLSQDNSIDLMPPKRTVWVVLYEGNTLGTCCSRAHNTKEELDKLLQDIGRVGYKILTVTEIEIPTEGVTQ